MFHVKHEAWGRDARRVGVELTEGQLGGLLRFHEYLLDSAIPRGYVAASDADRLWERHLLDSLRAVVEVGEGALVLDLGSGAGLPGIPIAIATGAHVTLVEERGGRAALLQATVERLGLTDVRVVHQRAQALGRGFDICLARAFGSVDISWEVAQPLLRPGGRLIYWAGSSFQEGDIGALGVRWRLSAAPDLADSGPLVIMTRQ
jgi:16S rRNA (guanine527-N7)-methyltransferase